MKTVLPAPGGADASPWPHTAPLNSGSLSDQAQHPFGPASSCLCAHPPPRRSRGSDQGEGHEGLICWPLPPHWRLRPGPLGGKLSQTRAGLVLGGNRDLVGGMALGDFMRGSHRALPPEATSMLRSACEGDGPFLAPGAPGEVLPHISPCQCQTHPHLPRQHCPPCLESLPRAPAHAVLKMESHGAPNGGT